MLLTDQLFQIHTMMYMGQLPQVTHINHIRSNMSLFTLLKSALFKPVWISGSFTKLPLITRSLQIIDYRIVDQTTCQTSRDASIQCSIHFPL